jgi:hypothetical protein
MTTREAATDSWSKQTASQAADNYKRTFRANFPTAPSNVPSRTVLYDLEQKMSDVLENKLDRSWAAEIDNNGRVTKVLNTQSVPTATNETASANLRVAVKYETDTTVQDPFGVVTPAKEINFATLKASATATFDLPTQTWSAR